MSEIKKTESSLGLNVEEGEVLTSVISPGGNLVTINKNDADIALKYAEDDSSFEYDPEFEKKLVRKIDWMLIPIIAALMSCQLMDKTTNSYASIMGLRKDLHMNGEVYSWVGSSFYFGYLVFVYPANLALQRFPVSKVLGAAVVIWGIILMCHAACSSSAPFLVCRVLLGAFEGVMNPAYILITSQWWRKSEQFLRTCIWFGLQGCGTILGAGIAYGLAVHREGKHEFASWRLLYIITGIITIFLGIVSLIHVPDIPTKAWFLNDKEKKYQVERIRENQQGFGNPHFKWSQFKDAITDPVPYILFIYGMSYAIPNGGFNNFGSILLNKDFGFSSTIALLMNMPGGAIDVIAPWISALVGDRIFRGKRLYTCAVVNAIVVVGMCLLNFTHHKGSRLTGYYTFYIATTVISGMLSNVSSNVAGHTKKVTTNAIFLVGYCVGNIVGPQTFKTSQAPGYAGAKAAMLASFCTGLLCILGLILLYTYRNKKRDAEKAALGDAYVVPKNLEFADLTDRENPEFRYSL